MKNLTALLVLLIPTIITYSSTGSAEQAPVPTPSLQSHDSIRQQVKAFIGSKASLQKYSRVVIDVGYLDSRLKLNHCSESVKTFLAPGAKLIGKTTVGVRCDSPKPWTLYVPATIDLYADVYQTTGPIEKGQLISEADISLVNTNLARLNYGYFSDKTQLIGKQAKRRLSQNRVITPNQVKKPLLIKRGEQVALVIASDSFSVKMSGTAMMNGSRGERIRVKNLSSKRIIEGTVTQTGEVAVD
ncbi:MAG: flagellar basal body P-ring formation chaperone FlgA [Gammaproteobacteria bacterium]|nr:flagellar basal body P-ring formation chaperone FlgA [Gammaproteobacteria bacterium]